MVRNYIYLTGNRFKKGEEVPLTRGCARYPPTTDEKKKNLGAFFGKNPPPGVAKRLPEFVKALGAKNPSIKSWGIIGVSSQPASDR
jgi:hypothetical protein